ncbi:MAG: TAXI family TRAP transporter solute-binding subunit [Dehalobacterium sp.]
MKAKGFGGKILISMLVLSLFCFLITGCSSEPKETNQGQSESQEQEQEQGKTEETLKDVIIASGPSGGVMEVVAAASAEILKNELGVNGNVIPGGTGPNVKLVETKQATMGITYGNNISDAWIGKDPSPGQPVKTLQGLMGLYPNAFQIWTLKEVELSKLEDLTKLRVCASAPGQAPWQAFLDLLSLKGLSEQDFEKNGGKLVKLSWSEGCDALKDKQIDVLIWLTAYPHPAIVDVELTRDINIVGLSDEDLESYIKEHPGFFNLTIPKGTYKNQVNDIQTLGTLAFYIVHQDLSEDAAYKIAKALYENRERLGDTHATLKYITKETVAKNMPIVIHPGAQKYYHEIGVPMDEPTLIP